jgi:TRAP-type uncharacterized transport system substrate-binding protein
VRCSLQSPEGSQRCGFALQGFLIIEVTSAQQKMLWSTVRQSQGVVSWSMAAAYADTINEIDPTLSVQTHNTKGSTEDVPLLEAGTLDTGQVTGEVAHEAIEGIGHKPANARILNARSSNTS